MKIRICRKCKIEKPITEFSKHPDGRNGRLNICKICVNITRQKRQSLPEVKAHIRKTREKRVSNLKKRGLCAVCAKNKAVLHQTLCPKCANVNKIRMMKQRDALRNEVFAHYGGAKCAICGESRQACLTIDHINNDGATHRKTIGLGGYNTYCWLKRNKYPLGFQVLCRNCNWIKNAIAQGYEYARNTILREAC